MIGVCFRGACEAFRVILEENRFELVFSPLEATKLEIEIDFES